MKKILTLLAIALAALTSCKPEEEEEISPSEVYLNVYYDDIVFPSDGGDDSFEIESNTDWVITNDADWLTVEPSEGKGNGLITLTASASDVYDDRNTVITVRAGDKTETFTVTQKCAEALLVTKNKFDIPQEGGDFTIEIQSNISYEIQIDSDSQSWISEAPQSKALTTYTHTFSVESNPNTTKRDGSIEIIGSNGATETVNIYQAQKEELVLSESEAFVPAKGGEVRVTLRSNVDYEVIIPEDADWVEQIQSDKADELIFNVKPNDKTEEREVGITVKDKNSDLSQTFTIKQIVGSIILEESYFEVGAKGGMIELNLSTDIDVEVVIPDNIDWITVVQTKSLEAKTISLDIEPNDKEEERKAVITIQDINSPLSQNIEIKQMPCGYYVGDISAETEEDLIEIREAGYKVIDGNVYLNVKTLSQLDNLIEEITGDLIIGDDVTSLDGLYGLKHIGKDLIYEQWNYGSPLEMSFEGLNNLESIGGNFNISLESHNNSDLYRRITLKPLKKLETIGGNLTLSHIENFEGPENLSQIGDTLILNHITSCKGLTAIRSLKSLKADMLYSFEGLDNLTNISGDFYCEDGYLKNNFNGLNNLQTIGGDFTLKVSKGYSSADEDYGSFNGITSFDGLNKLQEVGGDFLIDVNTRMSAFNSLENFKGLESLNAVNGDFIINVVTNNEYHSHSILNALSSFEGLTNLTKIGRDFRINVNFRYRDDASVLCQLQTLKGLDNLSEVNGDFIIEVVGLDSNTDAFNSLTFSDGPKNLSLINGDFIITHNDVKVDVGYPDISSMSGFSGLKTVNGDMKIRSVYSYSGLDNLEYIAGDFEITSGNTQGMSNLKAIGGSLIANDKDRPNYNRKSTTSINGLTGLTIISGNLIIEETDMQSINGIEQLKTVGGDIEISWNDLLEDISGFCGLTNCANISITNSYKLYNFQPLETAVKNMTGTWYVSGCGYNPTKYQMLNGESKPQE